MASDQILTRRFRYVLTKKIIFLSVVDNPPVPRDKKVFLQPLKMLKQMIGNSLWLFGGDFNILILLREKKGGIHRLDQASINFDWIIDNLHLVDIPAKNGMFT